MNYDVKMYRVVKMVTNQLTDDELVALNLAVMGEMNPTYVMGYKKAASLFTMDNFTRMHAATKALFIQICEERISELSSELSSNPSDSQAQPRLEQDT